MPMLIMIGLEMKTYVRQCRWFVGFGLIYVLVGDAVMLNLIISVSSYYSRLVFLPFIKCYAYRNFRVLSYLSKSF